MSGTHRAKIYRTVFRAAAIYNVVFGLWTMVWPGAFFDWARIAQPNYPGLWSCLGMVVGLYGILYA